MCFTNKRMYECELNEIYIQLSGSFLSFFRVCELCAYGVLRNFGRLFFKLKTCVSTEHLLQVRENETDILSLISLFEHIACECLY
jgi:hypothetical protein